MKKISLCMAATAVLAASGVQAQEAAVFKPNSVWAADYGDEYCRLVRTFSDGKDELTVILQRVQPGADTQVMLIGDSLKPFRGATELGWRFLPAQADRKSMYSRSETPDGQQYVRIENVMFAAPAAPAAGGAFAMPAPYDRVSEQATAKDLSGIAVTSGVSKPVRIETGALGAPVGALQTCADDLVKSWGVDAEKHKTLSMPAIPQVGKDGWIPNGTIPFSEFAKFAGGANQVRLMIDAGGKATSCHVFSPSLSKSLNDRICGLLMEKATFTPAKDAGGQAVASFWMGSPMFLGPPMPMMGQR